MEPRRLLPPGGRLLIPADDASRLGLDPIGWDKASVRARLAAAAEHATRPGWLAGDAGAVAPTVRADDRPRTDAAVLVGLTPRPPPLGVTVLLTQRTAHLRDHAGQISFPGGRIEAFDRDPEAAALREAEEEVGLPPGNVEVVGRMPPYDTVTGFRVFPVVGWLTPPGAYRPDPFEVDEAFEVPLAFVLDPANHVWHEGERDGARRRFYVLPFEHRHIWGATAAMLVNFARILKG